MGIFEHSLVVVVPRMNLDIFDEYSGILLVQRLQVSRMVITQKVSYLGRVPFERIYVSFLVQLPPLRCHSVSVEVPGMQRFGFVSVY